MRREDMLASKAMPSGITIAKASFSLGTSAFGYSGNGLPLGNRIVSVCLKNDKDEYYVNFQTHGQEGQGLRLQKC